MPDGTYDKHHLIPSTFKGTEVIEVHRICHEALHANITEREMLKYYHTVDRLKEHTNIQKFITWVKNKKPDFHIRTKMANTTKRKKRR